MQIRSAQYITGGRASGKHFHDSHQLLFVERGRAEIKINGIKSELKEGELVVLGRFERHSVTPLSADFCRYSVRFVTDFQDGERLYFIFNNRPDGFCNIIDTGDDFDAIRRIFSELIYEFEQKLSMSENMQKLLIDKLLILLKRRRPELFEMSGENNFEVISAIQKRFEQNYPSEFSLDSLGQEYNMSVSYLSHTFKKITGMSVMGYLRWCRLNAAKKMLTHTNADIGSIVENCGFSDSSNFSRTFKAFCGLTPSQFRNKYREN